MCGSARSAGLLSRQARLRTPEGCAHHGVQLSVRISGCQHKRATAPCTGSTTVLLGRAYLAAPACARCSFAARPRATVQCRPLRTSRQSSLPPVEAPDRCILTFRCGVCGTSAGLVRVMLPWPLTRGSIFPTLPGLDSGALASWRAEPRAALQWEELTAVDLPALQCHGSVVEKVGTTELVPQPADLEAPGRQIRAPRRASPLLSAELSRDRQTFTAAVLTPGDEATLQP